MRIKPLCTIGVVFLLSGCNQSCTVRETVDSQVARQQEEQQREANAQVPAPSIINWAEKRQLKLIQEKRDHPKLETHTYAKNMDGSWSWICESIGYGLPYDTRSNNPVHFEFVSTPNGPRNNCSVWTTDGRCIHGRYELMPQPEPNGLHIPTSARGTWNMCKDPKTGEPDVTYQEEEVSVFPYKLDDRQVKGWHGDIMGSWKP